MATYAHVGDRIQAYEGSVQHILLMLPNCPFPGVLEPPLQVHSSITTQPSLFLRTRRRCGHMRFRELTLARAPVFTSVAIDIALLCMAY